jgi:hypothetical protein
LWENADWLVLRCSFETFPAWSPYKEEMVQKATTFAQPKRWNDISVKMAIRVSAGPYLDPRIAPRQTADSRDRHRLSTTAG